MKCLFIAPFRYPFMHAIQAGMEKNGMEVKALDYYTVLSPGEKKLSTRFNALPRKLKQLWEKPITNKVNEAYLSAFREFKPDLVFVYNSQLLVPQTLEIFRKSAKVGFMLGDNPLYTLSSNLYNLSILFHADYIISPDSLWLEQLGRMGIRNIHFDCFGFDDSVYHRMKVEEKEYQKLKSDFIFIGTSNKSNWGFKRYLFLNIFRDFDIRIYISGGGRDRWLSHFPDLEKKVLAHDRYDPGFNNLVYNCSKIAPVEQVPSLFHGVHVRIFDALGAGVLPFCEYSKDIPRLFHGIDIPLVRDYEEGTEQAQWWLEHEAERLDIVEAMRRRVTEEYAPEKVIGRMNERIFSRVPKESTHVNELR